MTRVESERTSTLTSNIVKCVVVSVVVIAAQCKPICTYDRIICIYI